MTNNPDLAISVQKLTTKIGKLSQSELSFAIEGLNEIIGD